MPQYSIETIFATGAMIFLVACSVLYMTTIATPYLSSVSHTYERNRCYELARYILLNPGTPTNWGSQSNVAPSTMGLASAESNQPYQLDVDKVTRLNIASTFHLEYSQLWEALGVKDLSFKISIYPLFNVTLQLNSTLPGETDVTYQFNVFTKKFGYPVSASLKCYTLAENYSEMINSRTLSDGSCSISTTVPNLINGTGIFIAFAKLNDGEVSYAVHSFAHNIPTSKLKPAGTYMTLSPLNNILNVTFNYPKEQVFQAQIFTLNYKFNITSIVNTTFSATYEIPQLLDPSPMILVLIGVNGTSTYSFAEWVAYPQTPLTVGADLSQSENQVVSATLFVNIRGVLYEFRLLCKEVLVP